MSGWPVFEFTLEKKMWKWNCYEVLWIDSLFLDQGLAWSGQYMPNTPVTCHHKFQSDRCIWESTLHCMAFRRLCLFAISSLRFPSWPHRHRHQIPSLSPFRADVVILQIQVRQGGILFEAFSQSLAVDTWLEKHHEAHNTHYTAKLRTVSP